MSEAIIVHLRSVESSDFLFLTNLRRDACLQTLLLSAVSSSLSDGAVESWIQRRLSEPNGTFKIVADENSNPLGFVQIFDVNLNSRYGKLGIALAPEARGQGIGRQALQLLCAFAHDQFDLRKLLLEVRVDSFGAIHLYESLDFRKVGTLSRHYFDGASYHDVVIMERLFDKESDL